MVDLEEPGGPRHVLFEEMLKGRREVANARAHRPGEIPADLRAPTGHPKAVIGSHGNISLNSAQIEACYRTIPTRR